MRNHHYSLLALGRPRSSWVESLTAWSNTGVIPAAMSKCLSVGELQQRLLGTRPYSAIIIEHGVTGADRDLLDKARASNTAVFVVVGDQVLKDQWIANGANAVIDRDFSPSDLLSNLTVHAHAVADVMQAEDGAGVTQLFESRGTLIAVCGSGGTGTSSVAIGVAQGLADDPLLHNMVLLADFARNSEQAMLHDVGDISPGLEELVEASRNRRPGRETVRSLTCRIAERNYDLLLGQRRIGAWSSMPPRAIDGTIAALRRSYRMVIADITADFESEKDSGSRDVDERNYLARKSALEADMVMVVGNDGMKGLHATARILRDLLEIGVTAQRLCPIFNRFEKRALQRAAITQTLPQLIGNSEISAPIFIDEYKIDTALRDGRRLPDKFTKILASTAQVRIEDHINWIEDPTLSEIVAPVTPGSLGIASEGNQ